MQVRGERVWSPRSTEVVYICDQARFDSSGSLVLTCARSEGLVRADGPVPPKECAAGITVAGNKFPR